MAQAGRGKRSVRRGSRAARAKSRRLRRVEETSAGGLIVDREPPTAAALIGRYDRKGQLRWSLPKGHLEPGETAEQAAIREVAEETGINGRVVAPLGVIDFFFVAPDERGGPRRIHKTVHHFLLVAEGGELSNADGEVAEVAWVPLDEVPSRLTFDDERRLVDAARRLLAEPA